MKMIRTQGTAVAKILVATVLLFAILFGSTSCATTDVSEKLTLTETEARMFWEITGTSADGTPSTVYVLGTIHVGDERLYPLAEPVQTALDNADRIVGEISAADMASLPTVLQERMQAKIVATLRVEDPLTNYLTQEEITFLESSVPPELLQLGYGCDPWLVLALLSELELAKELAKTKLSPEHGLDFSFYPIAAERGIEIEGLDTVETQLNALLYETFSFEEQLQILQEIITAFLEAEETDPTLDDMYEAYLANDKVAIAEFFGDEDEESTSAASEKYMKILLNDRDSAWAKLIPTYIAEGGTTFIFAGTAHFVGDNSVFEHMKRDNALEN